MKSLFIIQNNTATNEILKTYNVFLYVEATDTICFITFYCYKSLVQTFYFLIYCYYKNLKNLFLPTKHIGSSVYRRICIIN